MVKQSVPAKGAVLAAAPKEIVITFNEKVEKLFSTATLKTGAAKNRADRQGQRRCGQSGRAAPARAGPDERQVCRSLDRSRA
ncbi:copper resistance protein CopC [Massilia sp. B-10]|nr:copper resistance protein CopC [Massilia sp. B-10]